MSPRTQKTIICISIVAAMILGQILERYFGWDGAFMVVAGIAVALGAAWVVAVILERRRQ